MSDITWSSEQGSSISVAAPKHMRSLPRRPETPPKRTIQEIYAELQMRGDNVPEPVPVEEVNEGNLTPEEIALLEAFRRGKAEDSAVELNEEPAEEDVVDPIAAAAAAVAKSE